MSIKPNRRSFLRGLLGLSAIPLLPFRGEKTAHIPPAETAEPDNNFPGHPIGIAVHNGHYVCIFDDGEVITSPDGITWTGKGKP
jgi:hypothetical protein